MQQSEASMPSQRQWRFEVDNVRDCACGGGMTRLYDKPANDGLARHVEVYSCEACGRELHITEWRDDIFDGEDDRFAKSVVRPHHT